MYTKIGNENEFSLAGSNAANADVASRDLCQVVTDRVVDPAAEFVRDILVGGAPRSPELRLLPRDRISLPPLPVERCPFVSPCES